MVMSAGTPQVVAPTLMAPASLSPMAMTPMTQMPSLTMRQASSPLVSAPALALQPSAAKDIISPLISAVQGQESGGQMFDSSANRVETVSPVVAADQDEVLRAKVEADISSLRSNAGYLGYSIDPGEPTHPNPSMQVRHVLVRMRQPGYITDPKVKIVYWAADMSVLYEFADQEDIRAMAVTLAEPSAK